MKPAKFFISAVIATTLLALNLGCGNTTETPMGNFSGSPKPAPEKSEEALTSVSLDDLNPNYVRSVAFEEVKRFLIDSTPASDNVNHVIDSGVNKAFVEQALDQFPKMAGFFKDVGPVQKYTIIWTTNGGGASLGELLCDEAGYCDGRDPAEFCTSGELEYLLVSCEGLPNELNNYLYGSWHAYGHIQQYAVSGTNVQPYWFTEGVASYFELHFAGFYFESTKYTISHIWPGYQRGLLYQNSNIVKFESPATEKNVIDALIATTDYTGRYEGWDQAQLGYYLGFLAVEALIASEGYETFKSFWRLTAGKDFDEAFEEVYGITKLEFFKKLAPYVVEMIERDSSYPM